MDVYSAIEVAYQNGKEAGIQELTDILKALKCHKDPDNLTTIICISMADLENLANSLTNKKEAE